jgi:type II secretory pathway pseudopilin PulG
MTEHDLRVQELETLVAQQRLRIEELEATDAATVQAEVEQLRSIIEAQEEAMSDQKDIIASQSKLLDELSGHLAKQSNLGDTATSAISDDAEADGSRNSPQAPRTPTGGSSAPSLVGASAHHQTTGARVSRGSGGAGRSSAVAAPSCADPSSAAPRRRQGPAPAGRGAGGMYSGANTRSQREQLLAQKLLNRVGTSSTTTVDPRAPRPNSALGRGGATPRARSWTERGSGSAPASSGRGPSPTRTPDSTQSSISKKSGGPLPPALPVLRQDV